MKSNSLKEMFKHFWNVTLGPDYQENVDIENTEDPAYAELQASLNNVKNMEVKFSNSNSAKGGRASKNTDNRIKIDTAKAIETANQKAAERTEKAVEEQTR